MGVEMWPLIERPLSGVRRLSLGELEEGEGEAQAGLTFQRPQRLLPQLPGEPQVRRVRPRIGFDPEQEPEAKALHGGRRKQLTASFSQQRRLQLHPVTLERNQGKPSFMNDLGVGDEHGSPSSGSPGPPRPGWWKRVVWLSLGKRANTVARAAPESHRLPRFGLATYRWAPGLHRAPARASSMRLRGVEPPRVFPPTRPSTSGLGLILRSISVLKPCELPSVTEGCEQLAPDWPPVAAFPYSPPGGRG
jgi:hypothetical protein